MPNGQNQINAEVLYQPASLDFSQVGDDLEQIGMQIMSYQREKQKREKARKDMMWQRYLKLYNIQPAQASNVENQKIMNSMYNSMLNDLDAVGDELEDDENNHEAYQKGLRIINQYKAGVNKLKASEQQYQRDYMVARQNPDKLTPESFKSIMSYQEKGGLYDGSIEFKSTDPHQFAINFGNDLIKNRPFAVLEKIGKLDTGEVVSRQRTIKSEGAYYRRQDPETGKIVENVERQKQDVESALVNNYSLNRGVIQWLKEDGKVVDKEKGIYNVNGSLYSIDPSNIKMTDDEQEVATLTDYYHNKEKLRLFPKQISRVVTTQRPEPEKGSDLTQEEKKAMHSISKGQRYEKFGKIEFPSYVGLGQRNLNGTAAFDRVTDPVTGKTVNIGDKKGKGKARSYEVLGIDPYSKKMLVALEGSDLKRTPFGKDLPDEMKSMLQQGPLGAVPDMKQPRLAVVDANRYRNLLEQEIFIDRQTNKPIFSGGTGIRPKPEEQQQGEENKLPDYFYE